MMDCDTTGVEPDIALVKYKKLVGGGMLKMVNSTVPEALTRLGYSEVQTKAIVHHIEKNDHDRGRAAAHGGAPAGLRLRVPPDEREALHPLSRSHPHDVVGAALPLRRHQQRR